MTSTRDLLFELGTEELPPQALSKLSAAFTDSVKQQLSELSLSYQDIESFATPRRLAVIISQLQTKQADIQQTKLGPALSAAYDADGQVTKAAEGFARSCGVSVEQLELIDTDKGQRLGYQQVVSGQDVEAIIPDVFQKALKELPVPKAMRWGNRNDSFVRPVKWLVAIFGDQLINMELYGCVSQSQSRGHRFMSSDSIQISAPASYAEVLRQAKVIVSQAERKQLIREQVNAIATQQDLQAVIDEDLLDEVSALVEWPVALMGHFDELFLTVPQEALISTMSKNQKYFHLLDREANLAPNFITIANLESTNPGAIIAGNERVIRPRLADAKFFYEQDCKRSLTIQAQQLEKIVFQKDLGSLADKCQRIEAIATTIASLVAADQAKVAQAAKVCKADLVTEMVKEFPSLQGVMGKYYGRSEGLDEELCLSLEEIYLPRFSGDNLPATKTGVCLALADRLDTLVGIFSIGQLPSGNKDPFALRRAALGIIHIILDRQIDITTNDLIAIGRAAYAPESVSDQAVQQLDDFIFSRLRAMYLEQGYSTQLINAVEMASVTSPVDFERRLKAVQEFTLLPQADALAASNKRVANILAKQATDLEPAAVDSSLLQVEEEQQLYRAMNTRKETILSACQNFHYQLALNNLAELKDPLDAFFDSVMVMDEDVTLRNNRLSLLSDIRALFLAVADIACLQK